MYISEEAAVVALTYGLLAIGCILLIYVKAQILKEEKEMNEKEMSEVVEKPDELGRRYKESIRKQNALMDQVDSLKGIVDERDDLRAQIYSFETELDSVIENCIEREKRQQNLLKALTLERNGLLIERNILEEEYDELCDETNALKKEMAHDRKMYKGSVDVKVQENETYQIKLEAQKEELEKITIERNALRVLLSRRIAEEAPCITRIDSTTGVNVETTTFTPLEEK